MKFDVYGKFQLEVKREGDRWVAYRLVPGLRTRLDSIVIPSSFAPSEVRTYLDDLYHEAATPGKVVRQIDGD